MLYFFRLLQGGQGRENRGPAKKNKQNPSFQPGTGRRRSKSPAKQVKREWKFDRPVAEFAAAGKDPDPSFGPIRITHQQLESPDEITDFTTESSQRRRRDVCANFERRFFTNNPDKARLPKLQSVLVARPPTILLVFTFTEFPLVLPTPRACSPGNFLH